MTSEHDVKRYAVIPTHNRHVLLSTLIKSMQPYLDVIIVIDNASTPHVTVDTINFTHDAGNARLIITRDEEQPPHLYRMWNLGFNMCEEMARAAGVSRWNISVFNDDVVLPEGWFPAVGNALRDHPSAVIACGALNNYISAPLLKTAPDNSLMTRMTPWAFTIRGEARLRANEDMRWWWGDTDFDWQACSAGGVLIIPGYFAANTLANSTTHGVLAEQAGRDREIFRQKWGYNPW